jgi:hypothetical protein
MNPSKSNKNKTKKIKSALKAVEKAVSKKRSSTPGPTRVRGRGNYFTDPGEGGTSLVNKGFNAAGRGLANMVGLPELSGMAGNAGSWLSRVLGFGSYKISKNSACQDGFSNLSNSGGPSNIPEFGSTASRGAVRVRHREFVTDSLSSTTFTLRNWLIHVGNPTLWPWLATLSQNFEEAQIHGCLLEFKPTSAYAVAGTQAMGNIIMGTDYDVVDENATSKRELEILLFSTSAMSNTLQLHPIECDPKLNVLAEHYIEYGAVQVADFPDDPRFGCLGNFQLAASGMPTDLQSVGELWVTYDVELRKPSLAVSTGGPAEYHLKGNCEGGSEYNTIEEKWKGFPSVPFTYTFTGTLATGGIILRSQYAGSYIINAFANGTDLPAASTFITLGPGVTGDAILSSASGPNDNYVGHGASANESVVIATVTFTAVDQTVFLSLPGLADESFWDVIAVPLNKTVNGRRRAKTNLDKRLAERDARTNAQSERIARLESMLAALDRDGHAGSAMANPRFGSIPQPGSAPKAVHSCDDDAADRLAAQYTMIPGRKTTPSTSR